MFREDEDILLSSEANLIQQRSPHWTPKDSNVNLILKKLRTNNLGPKGSI